MTGDPNAQYQYALDNAKQIIDDSEGRAAQIVALSITATQATLGLVFEQRTANLIALWQSPDLRSGNRLFGVSDHRRAELMDEIAKRLGLPEPTHEGERP